MKDWLKAFTATIGVLIAFDIAGVIACLWFDVSLHRHNSSALPYAIWLVAGVFAGVGIFFTAGRWIGGHDNWDYDPDAMRIANLILAASTVTMILLSALFWHLYWSRNVNGDYFVPDSMSHSLTYFLSVLAGVTLCRHVTRSEPKGMIAIAKSGRRRNKRRKSQGD